MARTKRPMPIGPRRNDGTKTCHTQVIRLWCAARKTRRVANKARNECEVKTRRKRVTSLNRAFGRTPKASHAGAVRGRAQRVTKLGAVVGTALALVGVGLVLSLNAHASTPPASAPLWDGTLPFSLYVSKTGSP